jgi:thymidylate kinase
VNRVLYPVGFSIALLGPDGSGKSTIANNVLERVSGSFHGGKVQYLRPYLLPAMGKLKFWDPLEEAMTNPNPHDHPRQNRLKSLLRFFYYLADYLVGYPVKIYWAKIRKNIIIFDRYYYDYLVDLHRYQFNIPRWFPRLFLNITPSPDITIYLDAEPEELFKRKQELSLPELERQVGQFRKILTIIPNAHRVSSNKPIDEIVGEITYLILDKKKSQTRRILKSGN